MTQKKKNVHKNIFKRTKFIEKILQGNISIFFKIFFIAKFGKQSTQQKL